MTENERAALENRRKLLLDQITEANRLRMEAALELDKVESELLDARRR